MCIMPPKSVLFYPKFILVVRVLRNTDRMQLPLDDIGRLCKIIAVKSMWVHRFEV